MNCTAKSSLFIKHSGTSSIYILVYVDDVIIKGSCSKEVEGVINQLKNIFAMKDLGDLSYFLMIEVRKTDTRIHLSQHKYVADLLKKARMHESKELPTSMTSSIILSKYSSSLFDKPQLYRSLVGALQYATITRPDFSFNVNKYVSL